MSCNQHIFTPPAESSGGGAPTGAAGGDLAGTYPNPTVDGLQTVPVSADAPTDGQVLTYDSGAGEWTPAAPGVGAHSLDDHTDVNIGATPAPGQVLIWSIGNGGEWQNQPIQNNILPTGIDAALIADGTVSNVEFQRIGNLTSDAQTQLDAKAENLNDLGDVNVPTPASGQVLTYNGTVWTPQTPASGGAVVIDDLTDVDTTGKANTNILVWNNTGGVWEPGARYGDLDDLANVNPAGKADQNLLFWDVGTNEWIMRATAHTDLPIAADGVSSAVDVVRANDSRLSNARTPSGSAGGDLSGTYPNPTITGLDAAKIADASVSNAEFQRLAGVTSGIQAQIDGKADTSHVHDGADITTGTVADTRLPIAADGVSDTTKVVRSNDSRLSDSRAVKMAIFQLQLAPSATPGTYGTGLPSWPGPVDVPLNVEIVNDLGISLSSGVLTFPAGDFVCEYWAQAQSEAAAGSTTVQVSLRDNTGFATVPNSFGNADSYLDPATGGPQPLLKSFGSVAVSPGSANDYKLQIQVSGTLNAGVATSWGSQVIAQITIYQR